MAWRNQSLFFSECSDSWLRHCRLIEGDRLNDDLISAVGVYCRQPPRPLPESSVTLGRARGSLPILPFWNQRELRPIGRDAAAAAGRGGERACLFS